ncbi:oxidoreductase [Stenotrophomonas acidaminiphila]|uniref:oxidoreductase n=1 Tax=Stenotrophomonas acidaminiphila TaxID=128780 RepID=UPI0020C6811A|nr:oxidoreductase [Stenotrophomonas acidaminiphila]
MGKRILLVGATGLVGQGVQRVLLESDLVEAVSVLARRPPASPDPRVQVLLADGFSTQALAALDLRRHDACLYCAGPLPVGMSEAAYREATVATLQRVLAAYAGANPDGFVAYISGKGADPGSALMPLRVKGEAEQVVARCGLAFTCLRPGIVRPVLGEVSPHRLRRGLYALGDPLLALLGGAGPRVFTTTAAIGHCLLRLVQATGPRPAVIDNADIAAGGG